MTRKVIFKIFTIGILFNLAVFVRDGVAQDSTKKEPEHLIFSETRIEGQFGTIKTLIVTAEKRPEFKPMALKMNFGDLELGDINPDAIKEDKYDKPFKVKLPE